MESVITLSRQTTHLMFYRDQPPAADIRSDTVVKFETERADSMVLSVDKETFKDRDEVLELNPVTGPPYIEDARPGDYLKVSMLEIVPCPDGSPAYVTYVPGPSSLVPPFSLMGDLPPETVWVDLEDGMMVMRLKTKTVRLSVRPFVGTIGTAPKRERISSYWSDREFCGNVGRPLICVGNEVVLPVNVDAALLSIGDVHVRQGDGEVSGCAAECRGDVVVKIDVVRGEEAQYWEWPQVNGDDFIGSLGFVKNSMERAIEAPLYDLVGRLEAYYDFRRLDAYELVAQTVELKVCQSVFPHYSCLAKMERRYL